MRAPPADADPERGREAPILRWWLEESGLSLDELRALATELGG
jgi:hypothetical protein